MERNKLKEGLREYLERVSVAPIQAFINSIALPKTLDDLYYYIEEEEGGLLDSEKLMLQSNTVWSVPRWCKKGDIVLFMTTVTSARSISIIRTELKKNRNKLSSDEYRVLRYGLMREESLYNQIGGTIFAIGRVAGRIIKYPGDVRNYAPISDIVSLDVPIHYDCFKDNVPVSKAGSITPVYSDKYEFLKEKIASQNQLPSYITRSISEPIRETSINKDNWLDKAKLHLYRYTLEEQFRKAFVDYFLKELSDDGKIFAECRCSKKNGQYGFIDNVILLNGKYLAVEDKLDVRIESDLDGQVSKYCNLSDLHLTPSRTVLPKRDTYNDKVIIIDTYGIYFYDDNIGHYYKIYDFLELKTKEDVVKIKDLIYKHISGKNTEKRKTIKVKPQNQDTVLNKKTAVDDILTTNESLYFGLTHFDGASKGIDEIELDKDLEEYRIERMLLSDMDPVEALYYLDQIEIV